MIAAAYGMIRSFCVRRKIDFTNPSSFMSNTEKEGRNAVLKKTATSRNPFLLGGNPANA